MDRFDEMRAKSTTTNEGGSVEWNNITNKPFESLIVSPTDLEAGVSELATGVIYLVYE